VSHDRPSGPMGPLVAAFAITATFMLVEAVAGWWSGSLALVSDAGHMLSDSAALAVAIFAQRMAAKPPDERHTMGHQRAEVLGAAINAGALLVLAAWVGVSAVTRLFEPREIDGPLMMGVAAIGLVVNLAMAALLSRGGGLGLKAALLNVLGDALGSVGVLVAGGLILGFGWTQADSVASFAIAGLIAFGALGVLREAGDVLMQGAPADLDVNALSEAATAVPGVQSVHDLHIWSMRPGERVVSIHVVLRDGAQPIPTCRAVERVLSAAVPGAHVTVQPEAPPG
jgi:cobalt-zinc-cadmium efflux system protein